MRVHTLIRARIPLAMVAGAALAAVALWLWTAGAVDAADETYTAVSPCSSFDSRPGQGGPGIRTDQQEWEVQVTGVPTSGQGATGACGIPATATAVQLNLVAVNATGEGNLRVFPPGGTFDGGVVNYNDLSSVAKLNNSNASIVPLAPCTGNASERCVIVEPNGAAVHVRGIVLGYLDEGLAGRVAQLEALLDGVTRQTIDGYDSIVIDGANLHLRDGTGDTFCSGGGFSNSSVEDCNGLGNLVIGYHNNVGDQRTGAHGIVIGDLHSYTSFGHLVAGFNNSTTNREATVTGGVGNTASGNASAVTGGTNNTASGDRATVTGGVGNEASGTYANVSGGSAGLATGSSSAVTGGWQNTASADVSSVTGGWQNTASADVSSVTGGRQNTASGYVSSVSGGQQNTASGSWSSVSGGDTNTASANNATVNGGFQNEASGGRSTVSGGAGNTASGNRATVTGGLDQTVSADASSDVTEVQALLSGFSRESVDGYDTVRLTGANLQLVDGTGTTECTTCTGVGNLIVGYHEQTPVAGDTRTGAHSIIVGEQHSYSSSGHLIAGRNNATSGLHASVTGGEGNTASGTASSVGGGIDNTASGDVSSVSGGIDNTASGPHSSVSGGGAGLASGDRSTVSGGGSNVASGFAATVIGGRDQEASGNWAIAP